MMSRPLRVCCCCRAAALACRQVHARAAVLQRLHTSAECCILYPTQSHGELSRSSHLKGCLPRPRAGSGEHVQRLTCPQEQKQPAPA